MTAWTVEDAIYAAEAKRDLAAVVADVVRAIRTLDPAQGPRGRRNARQRVAKALKGVQAVVDRVYPAPPRKAPAKPVRRRTVLERRQELIDQGYVIVTGDVLAAMAEAKITVVRTPKYEIHGTIPDMVIKNHTEVVLHHAGGKSPYIRSAVWAPGWAVHYYAAGKRGSSLLQIRKNVPMIRAAQAAIRLGSLAQARNGDIRCPAI